MDGIDIHPHARPAAGVRHVPEPRPDQTGAGRARRLEAAGPGGREVVPDRARPGLPVPFRIFPDEGQTASRRASARDRILRALRSLRGRDVLVRSKAEGAARCGIRSGEGAPPASGIRVLRDRRAGRCARGPSRDACPGGKETCSGRCRRRWNANAAGRSETGSNGDDRPDGRA